MYTSFVSIYSIIWFNFFLFFNRYEFMLSCWDYIPENRIHFFDIYSRLNEILLDENREQPTIWFSNEPSSQTVEKMNLLKFNFLISF